MNVDVITTRMRIKAAPYEWKRKHIIPRDGMWRGREYREVFERLVALDLDAATLEEVNATGIHPKITGVICIGCHEEVDKALVLGEPGSVFYLCRACLRDGAEMLDGVES